MVAHKKFTITNLAFITITIELMESEIIDISRIIFTKLHWLESARGTECSGGSLLKEMISENDIGTFHILTFMKIDVAIDHIGTFEIMALRHLWYCNTVMLYIYLLPLSWSQCIDSLYVPLRRVTWWIIEMA